MTPYEGLNRQESLIHLPYLAGDTRVAAIDRCLVNREGIRELLRFHLKRSKERMKQIANRRHSNCEFDVGDLVYVKL